MTWEDLRTIIGGVVAFGACFVIILLLMGEAAYPQIINKRRAEMWVLELDEEPITMGDLDESECEAMLQMLHPKVSPLRKLKCVRYKVDRDDA